MEMTTNRREAYARNPRIIKKRNIAESTPKVADYFGELTFNYLKEESISGSLKKELLMMARSKIKLRLSMPKLLLQQLETGQFKRVVHISVIGFSH